MEIFVSHCEIDRPLKVIMSYQFFPYHTDISLNLIKTNKYTNKSYKGSVNHDLTRDVISPITPVCFIWCSAISFRVRYDVMRHSSGHTYPFGVVSQKKHADLFTRDRATFWLMIRFRIFYPSTYVGRCQYRWCTLQNNVRMLLLHDGVNVYLIICKEIYRDEINKAF